MEAGGGIHLGADAEECLPGSQLPQLLRGANTHLAQIVRQLGTDIGKVRQFHVNISSDQYKNMASPKEKNRYLSRTAS